MTDIKYCEDCKHFRPEPLRGYLEPDPRCASPLSVKNLIKRTRVLAIASELRSDHTECGYTAAWFEPK